MIAARMRDWLPKQELLAYLEAIMRVYNLHGRRDNKYKARIKILVHELGAEDFTSQVEEEYARIDAPRVMPPAQELEPASGRISHRLRMTNCRKTRSEFSRHKREDATFAQWVDRNVAPHKQARLRHRQYFAQTRWRRAWRRIIRSDARDRRSGGRDVARRNPCHP